jgi:uncharacterized membrane protein YkvA (DUF1232 family)
MEQRENWMGPYIPEGSKLREFLQQLRLAYSLLRDARVGLTAKLIPILGVLYIISPIDLVSDLLPGLGQLDDLAVLVFAMRMFFEFSPQDVVREHLERVKQTLRGDWQVIDETPGGGNQP